MDINKLTIGEIAKVEELSGQSISAMADDNTPKAKMTAALAYVIKRREDPKFKFEDAMNLTMEAINGIIGNSESVE